MHCLHLSSLLACCSVILPSIVAGAGLSESNDAQYQSHNHTKRIKPRAFIVNFYDQEGESFFELPGYNVLEHNITVPGLSPSFPDVHCTADGTVCQLIAGEGEINAASSLTALVFSSLFDLCQTYFIIAGVAGIDPRVASIGSVTFARFAVQVDLQYEFDPRELPTNFTTGYVPQGSTAPDEYPMEIYGTEVFELNQNLRDLAMIAVNSSNVLLNDTADSAAYRALFTNAATLNGTNIYKAGTAPPSIVPCDSVTSNVYFSGAFLNEAFGNYTTLVTNGTGLYCTAQQEDNAVLETLLRGHLAHRTDFSRIIIMRTASDFVPPPPGISAPDNLFYGQSGYVPALRNLPIAGASVIKSIVTDWDRIYEAGVPPSNYIGDILGSIGGTPDFGMGPVQEPEPLIPLSLRRRAIGAMGAVSRGRLGSAANAKTKRLPSLRVRAWP